MIKITLRNGDIKRFNLKDFDREKSFKNAWYSMHGDEAYDEKKMRITTSDGTTDYKINDIMECEHDDFVLVSGEVSSGPPKKEKPRDESADIMSHMDKIKKERTERFIAQIRSKGVEPNMNDPMFIQVLESVQNDHSDFKLPLYANLYCNSKNPKWNDVK